MPNSAQQACQSTHALSNACGLAGRSKAQQRSHRAASNSHLLLPSRKDVSSKTPRLAKRDAITSAREVQRVGARSVRFKVPTMPRRASGHAAPKLLKHIVNCSILSRKGSHHPESSLYEIRHFLAFAALRSRGRSEARCAVVEEHASPVLCNHAALQRSLGGSRKPLEASFALPLQCLFPAVSLEIET